MRITLYIFSIFVLLSWQVQAQTPNVPTPGQAQEGIMTLVGATIHVGNGEVIENGLLEFENGKISKIGTNNGDAKGKVIDVSGKHVYPGLIAPNTDIGLKEVSAVRATIDNYEAGYLNPNVRAIVAYNTDSEVIPTVRSNGILIGQITPTGGVVSGQSTVVEFDAWNWEDATYKEDMGVHLNWPNLYRFTGWWAEPGPIENNKDYDKYVGEIKNLFDEAKAYCAGGHSTTNLKLEAMCGLFDGSKKLFANVNIIKEIIDVVNFAQEYGVDVVIVGGDDAWMCTDILKQYDIPVMINKTRNLPSRKDEDYDLPYKLPKILQDAGVLYCLTPGQGSGFWDMRNLPFDAGIAVAHGLTKEEALMSLTSNSAKILGIDKTVGTLEVGKDATLIVSKGDILDMMTSHVEQAFIRGRMVDMENKQKALYRRFMDKYDLEHQQH